MVNVLAEAGIAPETKEERKEADLAIRSVIGKSNKDRCNVVWKEIKVWLQDEEKRGILVDRLKELEI
jgi:hypothetical protein